MTPLMSLVGIAMALPIELNVEKMLEKSGQKATPREFRKACRDYAQGQMEIQREEF